MGKEEEHDSKFQSFCHEVIGDVSQLEEESGNLKQNLIETLLEEDEKVEEFEDLTFDQKLSIFKEHSKGKKQKKLLRGKSVRESSLKAD